MGETAGLARRKKAGEGCLPFSSWLTGRMNDAYGRWMLGLQSHVRKVPAGSEEVGALSCVRNLHHLRSQGHHVRLSSAVPQMRFRHDREGKTRGRDVQLQRSALRVPVWEGEERRPGQTPSNLPEKHPSRIAFPFGSGSQRACGGGGGFSVVFSVRA